MLFLSEVTFVFIIAGFFTFTIALREGIPCVTAFFLLLASAEATNAATALCVANFPSVVVVDGLCVGLFGLEPFI
tara:strand:- start:1276 stop:1500 length:225 start_codon:yes stop_codon:yes gene_type:complete